MTDPQAAQPDQSSGSKGPFDSFEIPGLDDPPRTSSDTNVYKYKNTDPSSKKPSRNYVILTEEDLREIQNHQQSGQFIENVFEEFGKRNGDQQQSMSNIQTTVDQNATKISQIYEKLQEFESVKSDIAYFEKEIETFVTQDELSSEIEQTTSNEINKRVVAPLLFGTAFILLIAAVGALITANWWISVLLLPLPILTGYYLWRSRKL